MFSMYQEEVMKSYVVNNARTIVIHSRQLSAKLCECDLSEDFVFTYGTQRVKFELSAVR